MSPSPPEPSHEPTTIAVTWAGIPIDQPLGQALLRVITEAAETRPELTPESITRTTMEVCAGFVVTLYRAHVDQRVTSWPAFVQILLNAFEITLREIAADIDATPTRATTRAEQENRR